MNHHNRQLLRQAGFTLVELLIVLALIGVVASLAYPSFQETIRLNRVQSQTTRLLSTLMIARSEAAKTNRPAIICKSPNGSTCSTDASVKWDGGWLVFRDDNGDGVQDAGEPVIRVENAVPETVTVRATESAFANSLTYAPDGTINGLITQIFKICSGDSIRGARAIAVDATGRPRVNDNPGGSCPE